MRIAISGTHSTGKSTLLAELEKLPELKNRFIFLGNITRKIKQSGVDINESGTDNTQLLVTAKHIEHYAFPNSILDRCALDGVVYTTYLYEQKKVSKSTLRIAESVFQNLRYDLTIWLRPEFPLVDDGERSVNEEFQSRIDAIFEHYIKSYHVKHLCITGTVEERVNQIRSAIEALTNFQAEEEQATEKMQDFLQEQLESFRRRYQ